MTAQRTVTTEVTKQRGTQVVLTPWRVFKARQVRYDDDEDNDDDEDEDNDDEDNDDDDDDDLVVIVMIGMIGL